MRKLKSNKWLEQFGDGGGNCPEGYIWNGSTCVPSNPAPIINTQFNTPHPKSIVFIPPDTNYLPHAVSNAYQSQMVDNAATYNQTNQVSAPVQPINPNDMWMLGASNYTGNDPATMNHIINQNKGMQAAGIVGAGAGGLLSIPAVSSAVGLGFAAHGVHSIPHTYETLLNPNESNWNKAKELTFNVADFIGVGESTKGIKNLSKYISKELEPVSFIKQYPKSFPEFKNLETQGQKVDNKFNIPLRDLNDINANITLTSMPDYNSSYTKPIKKLSLQNNKWLNNYKP